MSDSAEALAVENLALGALDDQSRGVIGSNAEALARFLEACDLPHDAVFLRFLATLALDGDATIRRLDASVRAMSEALEFIRAHCAVQSSTLALMICTTCEDALAKAEGQS